MRSPTSTINMDTILDDMSVCAEMIMRNIDYFEIVKKYKPENTWKEKRIQMDMAYDITEVGRGLLVIQINNS